MPAELIFSMGQRGAGQSRGAVSCVSRGSSATAQEQGLADFEAIMWNAFFLPKGTPAAIVNQLNAAMVDAMESPAVKERMLALGVDLVAPERLLI